MQVRLCTVFNQTYGIILCTVQDNRNIDSPTRPTLSTKNVNQAVYFWKTVV